MMPVQFLNKAIYFLPFTILLAINALAQNTVINGNRSIVGSLCVGSSAAALDALSICKAPVASATRALLNLSNTALSSGSTAGTYIGANPAACTGDFFNFQLADAARAKLTCAGVLTLATPLAVAQGGTGVTTSTGTTNVVLSASPTITSPVIANISPGADFTLTQNSVVPFTSVNSGALANSVYINAGKVGIMTASPSVSLHVNALAGANPAIYLSDADLAHGITSLLPTSVGIAFQEAGSTSGGLYVLGLTNGDINSPFLMRGVMGAATAVNPVFYWQAGVKSGTGATNLASGDTHSNWVNNDGTALVTLRGTGNFGINQSNPTFLLESVGTARFASLTAAVATNNSLCIIAATKEVVENAASSCVVSSLRYKDSVLGQEPALPKLLALRPVSYRFKRTTKAYLGLIAEDVYSVEPRLVDLDEDGLPHSVRYAEMSSVLVKGIQELTERIVALERR